MPSLPSLLMVVTEDWYFLSHRLALARQAQNSGFSVTVATGPGHRGAEIQAAGIDHVVFPLTRSGVHPLREVAALRGLTAVMRRVRPDIVHLVAAKPIVYGNVAAALAGRPPVLSAVAGLGYLYLNSGTSAKLMRATYEAAFRAFVRPRRRCRVLVQNADDADLMTSRGLARPSQIVKVTGSGVDISRFRAVAEPALGPVRVLVHSRMLWDKGIGELVAAIRVLKQRDVPAFEVRLVGDPDAANPASIGADQLRAWVAEGLVVWAGRQSDIPGELCACHIACLPSYREGAPLSLIEAAAAGRPIVTTDVPGCREIVRHEDNGLLVEVRDAATLANALERLIRDRELRLRLGRRGRERAEGEFAAEIVNEQIVATYRRMLERS
jgi:glycosyltransferase involved in cell wall biosynthesis